MSRHNISGLLCTCFAFGPLPYRSQQSSTDKKIKKSQRCQPLRGQASFPHLLHSAWPCIYFPNLEWRVLRLQWVWLSETIRPGDSSSSLPLFFMPDPIQKAFHLWQWKGLYVRSQSAVWKAAGNRLCNVFGGVVLVFTVSADLQQAEPPPQ